jgi:ankyrin repeat protein
MAEGNRIDTLNNSDTTLLYTRVDENNLPFANLLERAIKNDAEINEQDDSGDTALHIAIDKVQI